MAEWHVTASASGFVYAGSVSHCHGLLGKEPLSMLLATPVLLVL